MDDCVLVSQSAGENRETCQMLAWKRDLTQDRRDFQSIHTLKSIENNNEMMKINVSMRFHCV
jgi:hypothetical protein